MFKNIPRTVVLLGLVSFFNDVASEMIYPIVPIFLTSVLHTSTPIVGLIEGTAEATASITKFLFGTLSDYMQKRKPFVTIGYFSSSISKVLIGFSYAWPLVLFARFIDRLGKGLRTAARDSMLLDNTSKSNKGYIFGFHRGFDSLGAVVGPLCALVCLWLLRENIRLTFFIASIPAFIAVLILHLTVKEKKRIATKSERFSLKGISLKGIDSRLKVFLAISFLFALGNSSDAFLLLYAKHLGLSIELVILVYILYNISQTVFSTPLGGLSDKIGPKKVFSFGLLVFGIVYFLFGLSKTAFPLWILFPLYGIYIAATDGVSKAYISSFIHPKESGTYFGAFYTLSAIGNFLASVIAGYLWLTINPSSAFYYGSVMAVVSLFIFTFHSLVSKNTPSLKT